MPYGIFAYESIMAAMYLIPDKKWSTVVYSFGAWAWEYAEGGGPLPVQIESSPSLLVNR